MPDVVIGTCGHCGGDVYGFEGAWMSVLPPPPPRCRDCGYEVARGPVMPMRPPRGVAYRQPSDAPFNSTTDVPEDIQRFWRGDGWQR